MDEKQFKILKMIEKGTVTAEQGAKLLSGMDAESPARQTAIVKKSYDKKMFRILVDGVSGDKIKVQFPVGAVKKLLKATGRLPIPEKDLQDVDLSSMMEAISECLEAEIEGDFVNVESADGTTVRVFVEQ